MKSTFYLKHDLDARSDDKMRTMLMKFGARGYGIYWMIAEDLYRNHGRIARDYAAMAWTYHEPAKDVKAIVENFGLFVFEGNKIACRRVDRDLQARKEASEIGREALARRKRPDGTPWVKDADRYLEGTNNDPSTRRVEDRKGEDTTAAPSAADLAKNSYPQVNKLGIKEANLEIQLPFSFGDIPKGRRVLDIDPTSCRAILDKAARLGLDLRRALEARIKIKQAELHPQLRSA